MTSTQSFAMQYIKWDNYRTKPIPDDILELIKMDYEESEKKEHPNYYMLQQEGSNQFVKSLFITLKPELISMIDLDKEVANFVKTLDWKDTSDLDNDVRFRQYMCTLHSVNVCVFEVNEFNKLASVKGYYAEPHDPRRITFGVVHMRKTYYFMPILTENEKADTSVFNYKDNPKFLQKLYDDAFPVEEMKVPSDLLKLKIDDLRGIACKLGLTTELISDKSGKVIKKKKRELIDDIMSTQK